MNKYRQYIKSCLTASYSETAIPMALLNENCDWTIAACRKKLNISLNWISKRITDLTDVYISPKTLKHFEQMASVVFMRDYIENSSSKEQSIYVMPHSPASTNEVMEAWNFMVLHPPFIYIYLQLINDSKLDREHFSLNVSDGENAKRSFIERRASEQRYLDEHFYNGDISNPIFRVVNIKQLIC